MTTEKITIEATVSAKSNKVWNYYTVPEHITQWNFASPDWHCPSASNDMRVGGKYIARMEAKDGSFGFDFEAICDEIVQGSQFTYTLTDGRRVKACFNDYDDKTAVKITFDAEKENPIEMQRDGWQAILNNFKKYTEQNG